jgi:hypothetical protein
MDNETDSFSAPGPPHSRPSPSEHTLVVTEPASRAGSPQLDQANEQEDDHDNGVSISTDGEIIIDSAQLHLTEHATAMSASPAESIQLNHANNEDVDLDNEGNPSAWYKTPVLYKIACHENSQSGGKKRVNRYSNKPFEGLREAEGRLRVSVMDVCVDSFGMFDTLPNERSRRNQSRELFGQNLEDDDKPFKLGRDFIIVLSTPDHVRIMSKAVISFIKKNLPYDPQALKSEELVLAQPYRELAFTYDRFTEAIEDPETAKVPDGMNQTLAETSIGKRFVWELCVVRDWFRDNYYDKEIAHERRIQDAGSVTYDKLWLLFQPGTCVSMGEGDRIQFYIVQSVSSPTSNSTSPTRPLSSIELWSLDFKGDRLTRRARQEPVAITEYSGQKEIIKLPIIPLKYMDDGRIQDFVTRGSHHRQLFCEACDKPQLKQYHGALGGRRELQYSGAVVVDPLVCAERAGKAPELGAVADSATQNQHEQFKEPKDNDGGLEYSMLNDISPSETGPFEEREKLYLLLTGRIWGFALGKNQCAQFDVMSFTPPTAPRENESAFKNLAMVEPDLEMIKALAMPGEVDVGAGESASFEQTDFVNGKGLGKVILLHGPPGVGKSLTVECLARHMGRPLLSLKMTDIGTDQSAEQKLSVWLDFAQRWNAIVLLDEADTFLEQRKLHDLNRNALVAAFLHVLEYFPGLIFWTSNLPAWLDDAVASRFHLCVEYCELTQEMRDDIWRKFVTKSRREEIVRREARVNGVVLEISDEILTYVSTDSMVRELKLNGRDIRDAYHAAVRVAVHRTRRDKGDGVLEVVKIGCDDVRKVLEKKKAFHAYLRRALGASEALRAYKRQGRAPDEPGEEDGFR